MECIFCKIRYVEKEETPFNIRLNNHRKDANGDNTKTIPTSINLRQHGRNFKKHAKFTLIEHINNTIKGNFMQIEKALPNDCLRVSKVS